jgi:hypothetical protein
VSKIFPSKRKGAAEMKKIPALVLLASLAILGCGDKKGEVSGTVTYKGKPVPLGTVTFVNVNKETVGTAAISDGKYLMTKVPVGPVKILVTTPLQRQIVKLNLPSSLKKAIAEGKLKDKGPPTDLGKQPMAPAMTLPAKYGKTEETDLTFTVEPGSQEHPIELK